MLRPLPQTFASFVELPENRLALAAARDLLADVQAKRSGRPRRGAGVVLLHGPSGVGKSHLGSALLDALLRVMPEALLRRQGAATFTVPDEEPVHDLEIVEDLQHLPGEIVESFTRWMDRLRRQGVPLLVTADRGPGQLDLSGRLVDRLAGGLVVGLDPLGRTSRLVLLEDRAQRRQVLVAPAVLNWLADHLSSSGRDVESAIHRLEALAKLLGRSPSLGDVQPYFQHDAATARRTIEQVARIVGEHYRVSLVQLRSAGRSRGILLPRQVSMYLARQLTSASLEEIGEFFGGRDHSTVLHACRKIARHCEKDAVFAGTLRQLASSLA
jgi:chromosomal replication initiator protein